MVSSDCTSLCVVGPFGSLLPADMIWGILIVTVQWQTENMESMRVLPALTVGEGHDPPGGKHQIFKQTQANPQGVWFVFVETLYKMSLHTAGRVMTLPYILGNLLRD